MIQVIERVADIMNKLASNDEWTLSKLTEATQFNSATLCNILKSLIAVGWVTKSERGSYRISDYFCKMGNAPQWDNKLIAYLNDALKICSEKIQETVLIFTLHQAKIVTMAKATYQHTLMVNDERLYAKMSLYTSVSGEMLCACLLPEQRQKIFHCLPPTENDLQGLADIQEYEKKLDGIAAAGQNISVNTSLGIKSWALPIFDAHKKICACMGLSVPLTRLPKEEGDAIQRELHVSARSISQWLAQKNISASNIIKLPH